MVKLLQEQRAGIDRDGYPLHAPSRVARPALLHTWSGLSLIHWPYEPSAIRALLPKGLDVDVKDGVGWVGLVPFHCTIRPPGFPRVPWASSFEEMNVRTYVRGPDGVPGVWFITLDAARLGAVLIARATYGLSYFWSKMAFTQVGDVVTYASRRRWPQPSKVVGTVALAIDVPIAPDHITSLEEFLTNRWSFYGCLGGRLYRGQVEHQPWQLERARLLHCDADLVAACGLPKPEGDPLVHYSKTVDVRMSRPMLFPRRLSAVGDRPRLGVEDLSAI